MPTSARWWMTAFFIGVLFAVVARLFFPDAIPWPSDLPSGTQAALRLFVGNRLGHGGTGDLVGCAKSRSSTLTHAQLRFVIGDSGFNSTNREITDRQMSLSAGRCS